MIALGTWALANPLSVITALGLFVYGFLRFVYALFYSPLGVKPEEVGLGYAQTLSQSVVGILLACVLIFAVMLFAILLTAIWYYSMEDLAEQIGSNGRQPRSRRRRHWIILLATFGAIVLLGFLSGDLALAVALGVLSALYFLLSPGRNPPSPRQHDPRKDAP